MTTDEIIRRLKNILRDPRWPDLCASAEDVRKDDAALTAAIQAVKLLEDVKREFLYECGACKYLSRKTSEQPCCDCFGANHEAAGKWEFRWPLGEDTTT